MDKLLEEHQTKDALGVLMTYSVFAAHLVYKEDDGRYYEIDLEWLEEFEPFGVLGLEVRPHSSSDGL